jgi:hypothetical protein
MFSLEMIRKVIIIHILTVYQVYPAIITLGPYYHYQKVGAIKGRVFPLAGFARVSAGVTLPAQ